jgi:16S rRNA A1518/A1519 N6-dimethyltransferase RsmA/KsgA/DIM1 with predicted DNA glycosylase/AP lyase activity
VAASPPNGHSTELVRRLLASDRMISADLVLQRAVARWLADRSDTSRSARRYRLELGPGAAAARLRPPPRVDSAVLRIRRG